MVSKRTSLKQRGMGFSTPTPTPGPSSEGESQSTTCTYYGIEPKIPQAQYLLPILYKPNPEYWEASYRSYEEKNLASNSIMSAHSTKDNISITIHHSHKLIRCHPGNVGNISIYNYLLQDDLARSWLRSGVLDSWTGRIRACLFSTRNTSRKVCTPTGAIEDKPN